MKFETRRLPAGYDVIAPDGSEIRLLPVLKGGSMCHCTLPAGRTSKAVKHHTVEEIWYFMEGQGEVWRLQDGKEEVVPVYAGTSLTIPLGAHFQFRNTSSAALRFILVTLPPWPGADEAVAVNGKWQATTD